MSRTRRAAVAGFSLVEVLVSFALLGLTAAAVLALLVQSGLNNLEARRADALAAMARASLPDLDSLPDLGDAEDLEQVWCPSAAVWQAACAAEAPRFRRVVRTVPVAEPGRPGESLDVTEVTLQVTALQAGPVAGERTISLVTLRAP
ncbi:MAG: prepilin-type N-terminal cleavage/methylation domain-containing protein [Acidobacteriota bacterium]|nr:prepilin-type N-terminal cleavage/methylation domain-containing protein [Acidobacteriota bacterium]MDE2922831.1 prepilin-type N-terminal cleavage/methylation domain-containing protein [Acidobacteriota bacterium]MDE3263387.1 prepilin-type N-terminal cleavage/methylation domain-containing protein [Acidobacteriota bacterium]